MAKTELFVNKTPGGVWTIENEGYTTGKRFWVDSTTGSDSYSGLTPSKPMATLDAAINLCTADKGDIIYVMPGHAETITATDGFDADVAGIKIIGLGWGETRPTFTFTATGSQVNVGAASVWIENLRFIAGVSAVVAGVQVEGKTDVVFKNCEWDYSGTTGHDFVLALEFEENADRSIVENCVFRSEPATAGTTAFIKYTAACEAATVRGCEFWGDCATASVLVGAAQTHMAFVDNLVFNENDGEPYLEVASTTTGINANNRGYARVATISDNAVGDALAHCENFTVNTLGTHAIIRGAGGTVAADADS